MHHSMVLTYIQETQHIGFWYWVLGQVYGKRDSKSKHRFCMMAAMRSWYIKQNALSLRSREIVFNCKKVVGDVVWDKNVSGRYF